MTKKDYIKIAKVLERSQLDLSSTMYRVMVENFIHMFEKDNPKFDRNKFYEACGFNSISERFNNQ